MKKLFWVLQLFFFSSNSMAYKESEEKPPVVMNQVYLEKIVKTMASTSKGSQGFVEFTYENVSMYLISDRTHDRMRIISPVAEYAKLTKAQLDDIMHSNFHKALDARYAVSDGVLYAVYVHPLASLKEEQVRLAVYQVASLAVTFGKEYTSGVLDFGNSGKKI